MTTETAAPAAETKLDLSELLFDPARDHGTVHGEETKGASFEQDGLLFDIQGELITRDDVLTPDLRRKAERLLKGRKAKEAAERAYRDVMGVDQGSNIVRIVDPTKSDGEAEIDLAAWASGKLKVRFDLVAKAIADRFHEKPVNKNDAYEILRENRVI